METNNHKNKHVALQVIGSPTSQFYYELSLLYAKNIVIPDQFELLYCIAHPDGLWSVTTDLNQKKIAKINLNDLPSELIEVKLAVFHMFCPQGLTSMRIFFEDILKIPIVGSSGYTMKFAQDKQFTKLLAKSVDVKVPKGIALHREQNLSELSVDLQYPLIVKPTTNDNSEGLTLIKNEEQLTDAIKFAFKYGEEVMIEEFIAGRELRAALIKTTSETIVLPAIEYKITEESPIREKKDKYDIDVSGKPLNQAAESHTSSQCPALLSPELQKSIREIMLKMHHILNCRDFSMYDFRVCSETKEIYLLEAGLFWSFSKTSMISKMIAVSDFELKSLTEQIWEKTLKRK